MNAFERFFHGPHPVARAELFARTFLCLLAIDAWTIMTRGAGRHGVVDFNVAHFGWLDALLPVPSAGLATGILVASGLLAFASAIAGIRPGPVLALFALYTLSWSMSMIDSYQHHYLISLLLLCLAFFPRSDGEQGRYANGFGMGLLLATAAIVYFYTAVAKTDASWVSGHTLRRVGQVEQRIGWLADLTGAVGLGRDRFFAVAASSVIPLELFLAFAYAVAVRRDRLRRPWREAVAWMACAGAVGFHAVIATVDPMIGVFWLYMILLALCFQLPLGWIERLAAGLRRPLRALRPPAGEHLGRARGRRVLGLAAAVAALLAAVGSSLDLPGALAACALVGAGLFASAAFAVHGPAPRDPRAEIRAMAVAALALWAAMAASSARWDFYRLRAKDLAGVGELARSLEAARAAERHAPPGRSLAREIAELERRLGS
jgi:hypothetical protein